ncbi:MULTISPECIES: NfeD family protein [unclassified Colwellia]|uniref:NfeD family protein n=1 Tax=unclassified Colwellia TaxID=196834 RepID=UPI0015F747AA|nr:MULTISPECIES: NfeD family protein [unclassified Colwellia]MBA6232331.1 NfeD family protein [Colwellia sp. MB02u-7]MBA6236007.1 NfeD family protein [Colwellia sp. MB02u-11]MBA6256739.1 NfeD family protein [Colwellia sp. MB3u-28]MBA6261454.1 NfeD family protein [Colwellia sp. MB3u-41]MBA6298588.1 NfeD family protein [Colwellia sp. MB3u-22]
MEYILFFETWIVLAILFACAEIFVPGGILLNLGIASLLVAIGVQQQLLDTWTLTLTTWFILASFLLFVLYFVTDRFFSSEYTVDNIYEELDIYGREVTVLEKIGPGTHAGRVEFQGTTWTALGDGSELSKGSHATIVCKENISLVVEPIK